MFRLANHTEDKIDELYTYLSTTASKVIYNALDIWAGSLPAILDIYLTEFAGPPISENDTDFFEGISQYLSVSTVRSEINAMVDSMKTGRRLIKEDGRIGMELLARKIDRMKDKMADPNNYYTFDLFEEFLFAKMLEAYVPEMFEGEEDPYRITSDGEIAVAAERLIRDFHVGEELEAELGEEGVGKDYANWLAHTIQRIDQMDLESSEEAGYDSLFFWDDDYEIVFSGTFVEGIRSLVSGTGAILGYSYENVKEIFTDIGLKAPLLLVGSKVAYDITSEVTQERRADIMKEMPMFMKGPDEDLVQRMETDSTSEEKLPFN